MDDRITGIETPAATRRSPLLARSRRTLPGALPRARSEWLLRWFGAYASRYVRRHFNAIRISKGGPPPRLGHRPTLVYLNHASWWDPLIALLLAQRYFPHRPAFAPIDAEALLRYRFFSRLGFFGVEQGTRRGAIQFLRSSEAVLQNPEAMLWLTPQGRFSDVRERPLGLQPGLGHLAARLDCLDVVPLALEFVHWEEKRPEVLVRFGQPIRLDRDGGHRREAEFWTALFEQQLATLLDSLSAEAIQRDPAAFNTVLTGRAGVGGVYDLWRRWRARWRGQSFNPKHGQP
jgi:1-acyl-sn-glycerol-3-phosphate acyltransferase